MSIDVRVDTSELNGLVRQLRKLNERGISFATGRATNNVAFKIRDEWRQQSQQVFDRPTRLTQNSVLVRRATRQNPQARVFIRDQAAKGTPPATYLQEQALGGTRRMKRTDRALQAAGVLPQGFVAVPGQGIQLDAHGNMRATEIRRILKAVQASKASSGNDVERKTRRGPAVFALSAPRGKLPPGIYLRTADGIKPLMVFVRAGRYRAIFDIFEHARRVMSREAVPEMRKAVTVEIERALAKAAQAKAGGA